MRKLRSGTQVLRVTVTAEGGNLSSAAAVAGEGLYGYGLLGSFRRLLGGCPTVDDKE